MSQRCAGIDTGVVAGGFSGGALENADTFLTSRSGCAELPTTAAVLVVALCIDALSSTLYSTAATNTDATRTDLWRGAGNPAATAVRVVCFCLNTLSGTKSFSARTKRSTAPLPALLSCFASLATTATMRGVSGRVYTTSVAILETCWTNQLASSQNTGFTAIADVAALATMGGIVANIDTGTTTSLSSGGTDQSTKTFDTKLSCHTLAIAATAVRTVDVGVYAAPIALQQRFGADTGGLSTNATVGTDNPTTSAVFDIGFQVDTLAIAKRRAIAASGNTTTLFALFVGIADIVAFSAMVLIVL